MSQPNACPPGPLKNNVLSLSKANWRWCVLKQVSIGVNFFVSGSYTAACLPALASGKYFANGESEPALQGHETPPFFLRPPASRKCGCQWDLSHPRHPEKHGVSDLCLRNHVSFYHPDPRRSFHRTEMLRGGLRLVSRHGLREPNHDICVVQANRPMDASSHGQVS